MCAVSMISDHYLQKWQEWRTPPWPHPPADPPRITPEEIAEFRRLLERAREYDRRMGQPDCELEEKRAALKKLAEQLGVEIDFL